jgi:putative membrane protein insertion efficiency factor
VTLFTRKELFFLLLSLLLISNYSAAQSSQEIISLKQMPLQNTDTSYSKFSSAGNNNTSIISLLFRGYKRFISSQDYGSCSFYPSCSVYSIDAINKEGFFLGILNTIDRLSRCNGKNKKDYPKFSNNGLMEDKVRNHWYEEK